MTGSLSDGSPASASTADRIMRAALELIAARGLGGVSMSALATQAGVSRQTLYNHFPDVDSVVVAVVSAHNDEALAQLDRTLSLCSSAPEKVAQLVRHYAELGAHAQHGDVQQGLSAAAQARLVDHDRQVRHRIQQTIAEGMAAGDFRADLDPGTDAVLIHGLLGGVQSACASADRVSDVVRASISTALAALSD